MTCHCFLRPIRKELTSSSYTTGWFSSAEPMHTVNLYFFLTTPLVFTYKTRAYNRRFTVFGGHSFSVFFCQYLCSNPLLRGSALLFNFLSPDKEFSNMFVPEKVGDKAGKIALTFFVLVLNRWVSQKKSICPCFLFFPKLRRNGKRELYLRVRLKSHLLPDIPCTNFSGLNVSFLLAAKRNITANWKKRSNFPPKFIAL